jgi:tetratricopeptide (TPR) repeat protein
MLKSTKRVHVVLWRGVIKMDFDFSRRALTKDFGTSPGFSRCASHHAKPYIPEPFVKAEHLIRQQRPAQALTLLQSTSVSSLHWPVLWDPRWYLLVGWAMMQSAQASEARAILEEGLMVLKTLLHQPEAHQWGFLREWREWLRSFLGASFLSDDQPVQALLCYQESLQAIACGTVQDNELAMLIYKGVGDAYLALGAYKEAVVFFCLAKQRGQDVCDPQAQGLIEEGLGLAYKYQGDLPRARGAFSRAVAIFEQLEARQQVSQLQSLLGQVMIWLHRYDEAEALLRQALGAAERIGEPYTRGIALRNMAALHLARGRPEKAIRSVLDGLFLVRKAKNQQVAGQLYLTLARAYESQHDLAAAETAFLTAIHTFAHTHKYGLLARARERYGRFLANQGRFKEACEQLRAASRKMAAAL